MVVLATKVYVSGDAKARALDSLGALVENQLRELSVSYEIGVRHDSFPSVTIDGDDAVVARNLLRESWGEIVSDHTPETMYVGTLESWDETGIVLDAGTPISIPADELGMGPGNPAQVIERFGLVQHMPIRFVVGGTSDLPSLADAERDRLYEWTRGDGRLNINSVTRGEVRATLNRAGHAQDYVTIERLGLLEQSVVCKADTDPPGLLSSIGSYLPAEMRCVVT